MILQLERVISSRKAERPKGSYTTYLFDAGQDKILKKIAEEAGEVIIASKNNSHDELVYEVADLVYHLLVLLQFHDVSWNDIETELKRRHQPSNAR